MAAPQTNNLIVNTNGGMTPHGIIDYDMFTIPDDMQVYYGNALIFDSGLVSLSRHGYLSITVQGLPQTFSSL